MRRCLLVLFLPLALSAQNAKDYRGWPAFGGGPGNIHYSSLKQITPANVNQLKVAWVYDTKDAYNGSDLQANPIVVNGIMYTTTPKLRLVALDAATGQLKWSFDGLRGQRPNHRNRGVTYWTDGKKARILFGLGADFYSIDAANGEPDPAFGDKGKIDLRDAFPERPKELNNLSVPTPGVIYQDLIILGSSVAETHPSTQGDIRAYDVRTGKLVWTFHTIPRPGEPGYETWPKDAWKYTGGANAWAGLVVDQKRGTVFVPTGSAAYDFYGADRHGDNLYANSILCLDAKTGQRKWHFQTVKHDVWDLDFPSAPLLITVKHQGKNVDAIAQAGKDGFVYVLNRDTGESLFPLTTRQVPASNVDGELLSTTQRVPTKPAPFSRQVFTGPEMLSNRTPEVNAQLREQLKNLDYGDRFTPPSLRGTIVMPGFSGGAEWGGQAYDPETHLFYINANEAPWVLKLVPADQIPQRGLTTSRLYQTRCASCHGQDQKGAPPEFPAVDNLAAKMTAPQIVALLRKGTGRMPPFANLGDPALTALTDYLLTRNDQRVTVSTGPKPLVTSKYMMNGYQKFLDADGYPAVTPPWGTLNAINLDTGEYKWRIPFGEYPELAAKGLKDTGVESHGGGIVTAGGLFFIAASPHDQKLRAFDKLTGKLLWETKMTHAGNASISMYEVNGKQYVTVPAGGGRGHASGGTYITYSLP